MIVLKLRRIYYFNNVRNGTNYIGLVGQVPVTSLERASIRWLGVTNVSSNYSRFFYDIFIFETEQL